MLKLLGIVFTFTLFTSLGLNAQSAVKWYTLEEAVAINKKEGKKIFIDVYTKWCGWCKKMDKVVFQDEAVAAYLNENYIPVKLDAEQRDNINFGKKVYKYQRNGSRGYNEFAVEILRGRMSFPTVVFMDEKLNVIQPLPGYQDKPRMNLIMKYFAEDYYLDVPWSRFEQEQKSMQFAVDKK